MKLLFHGTFSVSKAFLAIKNEIKSYWDVVNSYIWNFSKSTTLYFRLKYKFGNNSLSYDIRILFMKRFCFYLQKQDQFCSFHAFLKKEDGEAFFYQTILSPFRIVFIHHKWNRIIDWYQQKLNVRVVSLVSEQLLA